MHDVRKSRNNDQTARALSGVIGGLFVLGGVLMLIGGDFVSILHVVFGLLFINSARSSWRDYTPLAPVAAAAGGGEPVTPP